MVIGAIIALILSFLLLAKICDEYFVQSLEIISDKLKLTDDVAGATFMAIGSSAPELFTAGIALMSVGSEMMGAGTIVGSALFNILFIVGASAVALISLYSGKLKRAPLIRDMMFYIWSLIMLYIVFTDGTITMMETGLFLASYVVYIVILSQWSTRYPREDFSVAESVAEVEKHVKKKGGVIGTIMHYVDATLDKCFPNLNIKPNLARVSFGLAILWIAVLSRILVESGVIIAHAFGIPEVVIGLTILAAGTSIPDLISSIIVSKKGQIDMAVSNAVGSNIFDIFIGLGLPWFLYILITGNEVVTDPEGLGSSILILLGSVILLFAMLFLSRFHMNKRIGRILMGIYVIYVVYQIVMVYI